MFAGPGSIDFDNIRESKLQIGSEKIQRFCNQTAAFLLKNEGFIH